MNNRIVTPYQSKPNKELLGIPGKHQVVVTAGGETTIRAACRDPGERESTQLPIEICP